MRRSYGLADKFTHSHYRQAALVVAAPIDKKERIDPVKKSPILIRMARQVVL